MWFVVLLLSQALCAKSLMNNKIKTRLVDIIAKQRKQQKGREGGGGGGDSKINNSNVYFKGKKKKKKKRKLRESIWIRATHTESKKSLLHPSASHNK